MEQDPRERLARNLATFITLVGLFLLGGGLLLLIAIVHPAAAGLILVPCLFVCLGSLHYLIWGWWLGPTLQQDNQTTPKSSSPR